MDDGELEAGSEAYPRLKGEVNELSRTQYEVGVLLFNERDVAMRLIQNSSSCGEGGL